MSASAGRNRHRVLLVRQWDQQVGGSGCCGRFSTAAAESLCATEEDPYAHARVDMEAMGSVYRALRAQYSEDDVDLTVVDPRNTAWLLPTVWRDARRRGLSRHDALRQMHLATSPRAVVCDGVVVATEPAGSAEAVEAVAADMRSRTAFPRP